MEIKTLFIGKTLFLLEEKILVVGDLHLGFENTLKKAGILIYKNQVDEIKKEFLNIFSYLKNLGLKINRIIFLGDIKESFFYNSLEKKYIYDFFTFLKDEIDISEKNIILIKGNHDTFDYFKKMNMNLRMRNFFVYKSILFIHGDKYFKQIDNNKIKTIIMGHLHPSIIISDNQGIRKEKYKCFLKGKFHKKNVFVLPSFLEYQEGTGFNLSNLIEEYEDNFSILPKKDLFNFEIYIPNKISLEENKIHINNKSYKKNKNLPNKKRLSEENSFNFGKIRDLN